MSDVERIEKAFGSTLYVHLSRHNRLDQAISRVRADRTFAKMVIAAAQLPQSELS